MANKTHNKIFIYRKQFIYIIKNKQKSTVSSIYRNFYGKTNLLYGKLCILCTKRGKVCFELKFNPQHRKTVKFIESLLNISRKYIFISFLSYPDEVADPKILRINDHGLKFLFLQVFELVVLGLLIAA